MAKKVPVGPKCCETKLRTLNFAVGHFVSRAGDIPTEYSELLKSRPEHAVYPEMVRHGADGCGPNKKKAALKLRKMVSSQKNRLFPNCKKWFVRFAKEESKQKAVGRKIREVSHVKLGCGPLRTCLLYTSPSPRDGLLSRMPSSA